MSGWLSKHLTRVVRKAEGGSASAESAQFLRLSELHLGIRLHMRAVGPYRWREGGLEKRKPPPPPGGELDYNQKLYYPARKASDFESKARVGGRPSNSLANEHLDGNGWADLNPLTV